MSRCVFGLSFLFSQFRSPGREKTTPFGFPRCGSGGAKGRPPNCSGGGEHLPRHPNPHSLNGPRGPRLRLFKPHGRGHNPSNWARGLSSMPLVLGPKITPLRPFCKNRGGNSVNPSPSSLCSGLNPLPPPSLSTIDVAFSSSAGPHIFFRGYRESPQGGPFSFGPRGSNRNPAGRGGGTSPTLGGLRATPFRSVVFSPCATLSPPLRGALFLLYNFSPSQKP